MPAPDHPTIMLRAVELARRSPGRPFAALLFDGDGTAVAEGLNRADECPLWHGEIDAIRRCCAARPGIDWGRLILYTTAEPCPMCQSAVLWAGIPTVVYGTSIPTLRALGWRQIDIRAEEVVRRAPFGACQLIGGVRESECDALFRAAARPGALLPAGPSE